jgi:hypothetical protein
VNAGQDDPASTVTAPGATPSSAGSAASRARTGGLGRLAPAATSEYLTEVAQRTGEVNSGRYAYAIRLAGGDQTDGDLLTVTGQFDTPSQTTRSTVAMPGLSNLLGGSELGAGGFEDLLGSLGQETETVTVGSTVYVRTPKGLTSGGQAVTTPWVSYQVAAGSQPADLSKGLVPFAGGGSPKGAVEALKGSGADLTEVGTETVDGVTTHHFAGTFDLAAAAAEADPAVAGQLSQLGSGKSKIDVWVDEEGIVRKQDIVYDFGGLGGDLGGLGGSGAGQATFSLTFTGVNQPVDITAPPAGQVTEVSEADLTAASGLAGLGGLGGLGSGGGGFDN